MDAARMKGTRIISWLNVASQSRHQLWDRLWFGRERGDGSVCYGAMDCPMQSSFSIDEVEFEFAHSQSTLISTRAETTGLLGMPVFFEELALI